MKNKAEQERALWTGLAKSIAHDMGTPLSAIMGWLELLPTSADPSSIAAEINRNADRLRLLAERLNQIGAPARIEAIDIRDIFRDVESYFAKRLPSLTEKISIKEEIEGTPCVQTSRELLSWALENLVRNSIDALPVEGGEIVLRAFQTGKNVTIEVSDNAQGISEKDQGDIFKPGFTTKRGGRGIGLSVAKYIIEDLHGSEISLKESHPGRGTTMIMVLKSAPSF